jgi:hypothetical protein
VLRAEIDRVPVSAQKAERLQRVSGGNYTSNYSTGSFCMHTGPSVFILANFGSRPDAAVQ